MHFPHKPPRLALLGLVILLWTAHLSAESPPARLLGTWRITRILPTGNISCWGGDQAKKLLGTSLVYRSHSIQWRGGDVTLLGVVVREVTAEEFRKENSGTGGRVDFAQLGIHSSSVTEVDLQHDDADITGATTEVPGDSVLLVGPNRIVVSACQVFYEATRLPVK